MPPPSKRLRIDDRLVTIREACKKGTAIGSGTSGVVIRFPPELLTEVRNAISAPKGMDLVVKVRNVDSDHFYTEAKLCAKMIGCNHVLWMMPPDPTINESYFVMEYAGPTLRTVVQKMGYFDDATALELLVSLVETLAWCHDNARIVHGDIKDSNLCVCGGQSNPRLKVIDFGNALKETHMPYTPPNTTATYCVPHRFCAFTVYDADWHAHKHGDLFGAALVWVGMVAHMKPFYTTDADILKYFEAGVGPFPQAYINNTPSLFCDSKIIASDPDPYPPPFTSHTSNPELKEALRLMLTFDLPEVPSAATLTSALKSCRLE